VQLENPGFETGDLDGWTQIEPVQKSGPGFTNSGNGAAKVAGAGGLFHQTVSVQPNSTYRLTAHIQGDGRMGASFIGGRVAITDRVDISTILPNVQFEEKTLDFETGDSTLALIFGLFDSDESRFDDFSLALIQTDGTPIEPIEPIEPSMDQNGELMSRINYLYHAKDGTDRLFVNDLNGKLYLIDADNEVSTYLDIADEFLELRTVDSLSAGLSTFAFHPDFESNGLLYTIHNEFPGDAFDFDHPNTESAENERTDSVVVEWTASDPSADTFSGTNREIFRMAQHSVNHGLQLLEFNRTADEGSSDYGILYLSIGDSEGAGDSRFSGVSQMLNYPQGKLLRINPDLNDDRGSLSANGQYRIPDDNPFVDSADGTLGEIWAYGFRNPIRFDWDPTTGAMLVSDIGERNIEEVNLIEPGNNYGWNNREGTFRFDPTDPDNVFPLPADDDPENVYPVAQYDHDEGFAIVGGFVYRGSAIPSLFGSYVFGDIVQGHLFHVNVDDLVLGQQATINALTLLDEAGAEVSFNDLIGAERADLRFGLDADGEIYIMSKQDGVVRQLVAVEE